MSNPVHQFAVKEEQNAHEVKLEKQEQAHESSSKLENAVKEDPNPYLIFHHSPEGSEKSPFSRKKKILKSRDSHLKPSSARLGQVERKRKLKQDLVFTDKGPERLGQMGMLFVGKIDHKKWEELGYSLQNRTVEYVPRCRHCNKLFQNHSGLGGHLRVCQSKNSQSPAQ